MMIITQIFCGLVDIGGIMNRKIIWRIVLAKIVSLMFFPTFVWATTVQSSMKMTVEVNGERFEVWGYEGEMDIMFRLRDIAYILNGTPSQFNVIDENEQIVRIERGVPYIVTGTELRPIPQRRALFGSLGFVQSDSFGFYENPIQTIALIISEGNTIVSTTTLGVFKDPDDTFFMLHQLSSLLCFSIDHIWNGWDDWIIVFEWIRSEN